MTARRLKGLIPAAGKGSRARPYTQETHKALLDVNGTPNMERIIGIMRDDMGIRDIVVVIGYLGETIRRHFGSGERFGVSIQYVENHELDKGLAWSVLLAKPYLNDYFCMMLCDECYLSSNHGALLSFPYDDALFTCAGLRVDDDSFIRKNYSVEHQSDRLVHLVEKPSSIPNDIMGSGTFVFSPAIFSWLEKAFSNTPHYVELISLLNGLLAQGELGRFFQLSGTYVNINDRDSLALARYHDRDLHFEQAKKALLIYAEGDEAGITFTIQRYLDIGLFHAVYVVLSDNSPIQVAVKSSGAHLLVCPPNVKLYGEKIQYAFHHIDADILVLTEADYSFASQDVPKLFAYLRDADMVIGTRTTRQLIEQGSAMRGVVRLAHAFLGMLMGLLWWDREARFTDTGCTFRAIWKSSLDIILPQLKDAGPAYSAEMMLACLENRLRVIEVPVNYFNRSASQNRAYRNWQAFFSFLGLLVRRRLAACFRLF